jgi:hypothetical protein
MPTSSIQGEGRISDKGEIEILANMSHEIRTPECRNGLTGLL